ncbi:hypothetical protein ACHAXS_014298 [Conticribra weissflogii]
MEFCITWNERSNSLNREDVLRRLQENDPLLSSLVIMMEYEEYETEVEGGYHFHNHLFRLNIDRSDDDESGWEDIPSSNEDDSSFNKSESSRSDEDDVSLNGKVSFEEEDSMDKNCSSDDESCDNEEYDSESSSCTEGNSEYEEYETKTNHYLYCNNFQHSTYRSDDDDDGWEDITTSDEDNNRFDGSEIASSDEGDVFMNDDTSVQEEESMEKDSSSDDESADREISESESDQCTHDDAESAKQDDFEMQIGKAIGENTELKSLIIHLFILPGTEERISRALRNIFRDGFFSRNRGLKNFEYSVETIMGSSGQDATDIGIRNISPYLQLNEKLESFGFRIVEEEEPDPHTASLLLRALATRSTRLSSITLNLCDFTGVFLGEHFRSCPYMIPKKFDLRYNCIGLDQCMSMSEIVRHDDCHLEELDLSSNPISDDGVDFISGALASRRHPLKLLNLSSTRISDDGIMALVRKFQDIPDMIPEKLYLTNNKLSDDVLHKFLPLLARRSIPMDTLELRHNNIANTGIFALSFLSNPSVFPSSFKCESTSIRNGSSAVIANLISFFKVNDNILSTHPQLFIELLGYVHRQIVERVYTFENDVNLTLYYALIRKEPALLGFGNCIEAKSKQS